MAYIVLAIIAISAFPVSFHRWNMKPVKRSPEEICALLESWFENNIDWGEWDYFESCVIEDPNLETIRQECLEIALPDSGYINADSDIMNQLNKAGRNRVRNLLNKC